MNQIDIEALQVAAQKMHSGFSGITRLYYVKGMWKIAETQVNGIQLVARPDWLVYGWTKLWDNRPVAHHVGYVVERYVPPARELLGDRDKDLWAIYCNKRDPWMLQWTLPLFNATSNEQFVWSTNTKGGADAIASVLNAYCDRVKSNPEDSTILPIVEANTGGYNRSELHGFIHTPQLNILGWTKPPLTPRPVLPAPPPLVPLPSSEDAPVEDASAEDAS